MGTTAEKNVFTFDYEVFRMRLIGFQHDHEKQESPREKYLKDFKDFKSKRKPYRKDEDKQILEWILKNQSFNLLGGKTIWKIMEPKVCNNQRPWESLQERFNKSILPNIESYNMPSKIVKKFRRSLEVVGSSLSSEQKETAGDSDEPLMRESVKTRVHVLKKRNCHQTENYSSSEEEKRRRPRRKQKLQEQQDQSESWCEADQSDQKSEKEDTESSRDEQQKSLSVLRENTPTQNLLVVVPDEDINSEREIENCSAPRRNLGEKGKTVPSSTADPEMKGPGQSAAPKNTSTVNDSVEEDGQATIIEDSPDKLQSNPYVEDFPSMSDSNPLLVESMTDPPDCLQDGDGAPSVVVRRKDIGEGPGGGEVEGRKENTLRREGRLEAEEKDQIQSKDDVNRPKKDTEPEKCLEMFQVPSDIAVNNPSSQDSSNPWLESVVSTPDWQQAVASTFQQQDEENVELAHSVGDGMEGNGDIGGGSVGAGHEVEEEEGEEADSSFEILPVVAALRTPMKRKRKRKIVDRRTEVSDKVISGQLLNSSNLLPSGRCLPDPKHVPGELLIPRSGRNCGSSLSLLYRNTMQSLPRTDQTYDWQLNCFSPDAADPSGPEEEDHQGATGTSESREENDDPPAVKDRSESGRNIRIRNCRSVEVGTWEMMENDEECVLIIKGASVPRESVLPETTEPFSKRLRIIFVSNE